MSTSFSSSLSVFLYPFILIGVFSLLCWYVAQPSPSANLEKTAIIEHYGGKFFISLQETFKMIDNNATAWGNQEWNELGKVLQNVAKLLCTHFACLAD